MRPLKISVAQLWRAICRAHRYSNEWQAECCEIVMLPLIARRWQQANADRFAKLQMLRHRGKKYAATHPEDNRRITAEGGWAQYAGYVLYYGGNLYWNRVTSDYYGHSAAVAWSGVCRETRMALAVEHMRLIAWWYMQKGGSVPPQLYAPPLRWGIEVVG